MKLKKIIESNISTLGGGNNSARWTAPGQKRKINIEQLSGYEQLDYPTADELDISKEKHHWIGGGKTKKYHNKVRAVRNENGSLTLEKKTTMKLTKTQLREIIRGEVQSLKEAAPKLKPKMYIMVKNTRTGEEHVVAGFAGAGDAHIALPAFTKIAPAHMEYRIDSGK